LASLYKGVIMLKITYVNGEFFKSEYVTPKCNDNCVWCGICLRCFPEDTCINPDGHAMHEELYEEDLE